MPLSRIHTLTTAMSLPLPREQVFTFFAEATNLERITPPELGFEILTPRPIHLSAGALIDYQLRLFGITFHWQTQILQWHPPSMFVDTQRRGPYKLWVHTHHFHAQDGVTRIEDIVQYSLPFWPCGEIGYPLVQRQLQRIFRYRQQAIQRCFAEGLFAS